MEWVASTLHTTPELGVSSITTADAHTSAASSRLNCCPRRFKRTSPFRRKMKSGFCVCAITFQMQSTTAAMADCLILQLHHRTTCCCVSTDDCFFSIITQLQDRHNPNTTLTSSTVTLATRNTRTHINRYT